MFDNRKYRFALALAALISAFGCDAEAEKEAAQVTDLAHAQNDDRLILTRLATATTPGFNDLARQLGGQVITFEDLVANFPAANIPESVRAGLKFLKFGPMPNLLHVNLVGSTPTIDCDGGENTADFRCGPTDVPLYYIRTWARWNDDPRENAVPSIAPYGYLRSDWPDLVGGPYATPEVYFPDVNVGLVSLYGTYALETYRDKLAVWMPPDIFRSSQFYSGYCPAVHDPMGPLDNSLAIQTEAAPVIHDCKRPGEENGGDIGKLATADGSVYTYYNYHGSIAGSCPAGGYCYNQRTAFGGIVYALACNTGAPDLWPTALGEALLASPQGAIAYLGYARLADGRDAGDPMPRAFVAGRWTLGEAVSGYRQEIASTLPRQKWWRDLLSLTLYGPSSLPVAALPKAGVKTVASHANADGSITADVEAFGAGQHWLALGDRILTAIGDGEVKRVTIDATDAKLVFHLLDCDPNREICQAAQVAPEPKFRLDCGRLARNPDDTLGVDVAVPTGQESRDVAATVTAIDQDCPTGDIDDCFDVNYGARNERQLASVVLPQLTAGANRVNFAAAPPTIAGHHFRALQIRLADQSGSPIASCFVPVTETEVKNYGLDQP